MSPTASQTAGGASRGLRLFETAAAKKAVVAVTGVVMVGFVVVHMLGNLQVFLGAEHMNSYAAMLKSNAEILWGARSVLLVSVAAHIIATLQLLGINRRARPVAYVKKDNSHSSLASKTMYLSGPTLFFGLLYHLLHLTVGSVHPAFSETDVYANVVHGFSVLPVALVYIIFVACVALHVSHGIRSMVHTLGYAHPVHSARIRTAAGLIALVLFLGFASVPVSVLAGIVHL